MDPTIAVFEKYAEVYQQKYMDQGRYALGLNRCCDLIVDDRGSLLDLACGPGNVSRYLLDQKPNLQVEAIDLSPAMVALAQKNVPQAVCSVGDVREFKNRKGKYDLIVAGFCIPYLSIDEVKELVESVAKNINEKGVLYLSFMEGDYEMSGYQMTSDGKDKAYIHYYPATVLATMLQSSGFEIDTLLRTDFVKDDGRKDVDVQIVAIKKQDDHHKVNDSLC